MPSLMRLAVVAKLWPIAGSAVTMMVPSRFCMNCAQATMSAICSEGRAIAARNSRSGGIPLFYRDRRRQRSAGAPPIWAAMPSANWPRRALMASASPCAEGVADRVRCTERRSTGLACVP